MYSVYKVQGKKTQLVESFDSPFDDFIYRVTCE